MKETEGRRSVWVGFRNALFDPVKGRALYNRYLDELEMDAADHHEAGFANLVCLMQFGTLPHDKTARNIELFAREVLPAIQPLGDRDYRGFEAKVLAAE